MGIDPAFDFIFNRLRPYSKMLTLPMVHPVPRKLARHPWLAHAIFFNGLNVLNPESYSASNTMRFC
jgi:hypothetical protein